MVIENKPSEFNKLAKKVDKTALRLNLSPIYGLENAYGYGRSLAVWLIEKGYVVKDVNPSLAYDQRKSAPMMKKNDEHDAYCVATVLINQLHTLPDAKPEDNHWTLSQLVNRRDLPKQRYGCPYASPYRHRGNFLFSAYHPFFCPAIHIKPEYRQPQMIAFVLRTGKGATAYLPQDLQFQTGYLLWCVMLTLSETDCKSFLR